MEWSTISQALFSCMGICIAGWVARSIDKMKDSVDSLNIKIAVVIDRQDSHEHRISRLESKE